MSGLKCVMMIRDRSWHKLIYAEEQVSQRKYNFQDEIWIKAQRKYKYVWRSASSMWGQKSSKIVCRQNREMDHKIEYHFSKQEVWKRTRFIK